MIIFHHASIVQSSTFAAGLEAPDRRVPSTEPKPRPKPVPVPRPTPTPRREVAATERAWHLGFSACQADGPDVECPSAFSEAERQAFNHGRDACFMGAWDAIDDRIDRLQAEDLDRMMCGL